MKNSPPNGGEFLFGVLTVPVSVAVSVSGCAGLIVVRAAAGSVASRHTAAAVAAVPQCSL